MEIFIILVLLLLNGVFAMYEIALVSSSEARLETLASSGSRRAREVLKQKEEPEKILSAIQVGITLIGIVSGAFGGVALADDLVPLFASVPVLESYAGKLAMVTVVGCITYLSLIIGELVPKTLALNNPERIAMFLSSFMRWLTRISYPFVLLLSVSTKVVSKFFGINSAGERFITEDELKFILHQSSQQGVINKEETEMIKDVFRFGDKRVNELMTHRTEVINLYTNQRQEEVLSIIETKHFSKYLLYETSSIDECLGVVSVKDIIVLLTSGETFDLRKIVQEPLYIPESLNALRTLETFKTNKRSFGVVVNEYGSVEGIITLHDLTESIFGEIPEEGEEIETEIIKRQDGSFLVDGSMNLDDFMDEMGVLNFDDLESEGFNTLSGMTMFFLGCIPKEGDSFVYRNLKFEVVDMDNSRVDKLLIYKIEQKD
ncbi:MAG: HlyC/CorC family transporter [Bacteroidaceae bacterium]|nr:HlyC/CorC family transporter [Bacteroidaceae bacterium]